MDLVRVCRRLAFPVLFGVHFAVEGMLMGAVFRERGRTTVTVVRSKVECSTMKKGMC